MTDTEPAPERRLPTVGPAPQEPPQQVSLGDLANAVGPLATAYFEHQERTQQRELGFEERVLEAESKRFRHLLVVGSMLGLALVALSTVLVLQGKVDDAKDLMTFVVSVAAAAFGGYGIARSRPRRSEPEE